MPFSLFLTELNTFISLAATTTHEFLITGDFNLHLDHPDDSQVKQFLAALDSTCFLSYSSRSSYPWSCYHSHFLFSQPCYWPLPYFSFWSLTYFLFSFNLSKHSSASNSNIFRCFKSIRVSKFTRHILHSRLITHPPPNLSDLVDAYSSTLTLIDIHAPLKTKTIRAKPFNKWFTPALSALKTARRHLENLLFLIHSPHHLKLLRIASNKYHSAIIAAKKRFNASLIASSSSNLRKLWYSINTVLERKPTPLLSSLASTQSLLQMFATFFTDKILKLHTALKSSSTIFRQNTPTILSAFSFISEDEVSKIISQSSNCFSDLDPIPTSLLKQCLSALLPILTKIINLSLASGNLSWSIQILFCHSSSQEIQSWQRRPLQL